MRDSKAFKERNSYVAGSYFVGDKKDGALAVIPLAEKQQKILSKEVELHPLRGFGISVGGLGVMEGVSLGGAAAGLPAAVAVPLYGAGFAINISGSFGDMTRLAKLRMQKRKIMDKQLLDRFGYMEFADRTIVLKLPRKVLQREVTFTSELGEVAKPAAELLESVNHGIAGMSVEKVGKKNIRASINPHNLIYKALMRTPQEHRGEFLGAAHTPLSMLYDAQQQIPRRSPDWATLPEGLRAAEQAASTQLLIGTLGVFGVLRAQTSVRVADAIKDMYAKRTSLDERNTIELLHVDAERFDNPTSENLSWTEVSDTEAYLNSLPG